jgi:hypothetical protein
MSRYNRQFRRFESAFYFVDVGMAWAAAFYFYEYLIFLRQWLRQFCQF